LDISGCGIKARSFHIEENALKVGAEYL